jgi:hypothetical protein
LAQLCRALARARAVVAVLAERRAALLARRGALLGTAPEALPGRERSPLTDRNTAKLTIPSDDSP